MVNKIDLVRLRDARMVFSIYEEIGYPVFYTSAETGKGVEKLHKQLQGRLSALLGPSGVGKTSLLNAIQPHLGLDVREVSQATTKGRHTTVVRQMFPLKDGGYVADLPGLRQLALWDIEPEELDAYFPEIGPLVADCQYNDCSHLDDPGCAVHKAVDDGRVSPERYESYLRMRFGDDLDEMYADEEGRRRVFRGGPMSDERLTWQRYILKFHNPFRVSYGFSETRKAHCVRLANDEGWGEGTIPPYYGVKDEDMIAYWAKKRDLIALSRMRWTKFLIGSVQMARPRHAAR